MQMCSARAACCACSAQNRAGGPVGADRHTGTDGKQSIGNSDSCGGSSCGLRRLRKEGFEHELKDIAGGSSSNGDGLSQSSPSRSNVLSDPKNSSAFPVMAASN